MPPIYLSEDDVAATLPMGEALRLLEEAARAISDGTAMNAPRQRVKANGTILHVLPASLGARLGHKSYTSAPRGAVFWFTLYAASGEMLAIVQADRLGQIRTGAASGLATKFMAKADARTLGVIGTGWQARSQIEAVCAARPIERVRVWGRDPERLATFCKEMTAQLARPIEPAAGPREAVMDADVVVTMTSSARPVFEGAWLAPGAHVNAAGSNKITSQEIDVETVRRAAIVAVEDVAQARVESGDLRAASEAGVFRWLDAVRIADIVAGKIDGRRDAQEITLFESLGVGIWDLAVGSYVYDACVAAGRGVPLPFPG
jgi:ornithine cyclodeaminase/alanine dehydrogenase-like protein (mu-crystallin family)